MILPTSLGTVRFRNYKIRAKVNSNSAKLIKLKGESSLILIPHIFFKSKIYQKIKIMLSIIKELEMQ